MAFPWSAWFASLAGDFWPLLITVAFQAVYYFVGLYRLLNGKGPLPEQANPEIPDV